MQQFWSSSHRWGVSVSRIATSIHLDSIAGRSDHLRRPGRERPAARRRAGPRSDLTWAGGAIPAGVEFVATWEPIALDSDVVAARPRAPRPATPAPSTPRRPRPPREPAARRAGPNAADAKRATIVAARRVGTGTRLDHARGGRAASRPAATCSTSRCATPAVARSRPPNGSTSRASRSGSGATGRSATTSSRASTARVPSSGSRTPGVRRSRPCRSGLARVARPRGRGGALGRHRDRIGERPREPGAGPAPRVAARRRPAAGCLGQPSTCRGSTRRPAGRRTGCRST